MSELITREAPDHLSRASFEYQNAAFHFLAMSDFVDSIKDTTVARVTLWDTKSRVIYSDLN